MVYLLRADSAAEQACWVNEMERYVSERLEYERKRLAYDVSKQEASYS